MRQRPQRLRRFGGKRRGARLRLPLSALCGLRQLHRLPRLQRLLLWVRMTVGISSDS